MAEALLRAWASESFDAASAGTEATRVHPLAVAAMAEIGIDIARHTSKTVDSLLADTWDYVITVCDSANERCPVFPARTIRIHWSFEDPSQARGDDAERMKTFRRVRDEIGQRIQQWVASVRPLP